jgi:hypothetical protein
MDSPQVLIAMATKQGFEAIIDSIDAVALEAQEVVNALAPTAFRGAEGAFGMSTKEIFDAVREIDLEQVDDPELREQFATLDQLYDFLEFPEDGEVR